MKKLISTLVFSFISYIAFTQISPNLINSSTLIIEGKIIEQRCIENEKDDNIYTLNTIKILKKFKGFTNSKIITLVTIGGKIENIEQTWSHGFSLSNEQEGIFFLNKDILISSEFFVIANNREGFIRFVDYDDLCPKAYSEHFQGANIQNSVYEVLEDLTHNKLEIVELNK